MAQTDDAHGSAGARKDLASSPAKKQAAAQAIENHIEPDTRKSGGLAEDDTKVVVKEFDAKDGHGWATSKALKDAHETWSQQVDGLMGRLAADKGALRNTNRLFQGTDVGVMLGLRPPSKLDHL